MTLFQEDILTTLLTKHINNQNKTENQFELLGKPCVFDLSSKVMNLGHAVLFRWAHWNGTLIYLAGVLCFLHQQELLGKMQFPFGTIATLYRGSISIHFFYLFFRETKLSHCEQFKLWRRACLFMQIHKLGKYWLTFIFDCTTKNVIIYKH